MELSEGIRLRIKNLMEINNINASTLSTRAGISRATLSKFLSGERRYLRIDIIEYICEACNITLADFFNDKVFINVVIND